MCFCIENSSLAQQEYSGLTQAEELPKPKLNGPLAYTLPFSTVTLTVGPEIRSLRGEQIANMSWQEHRDVYKVLTPRCSAK